MSGPKAISGYVAEEKEGINFVMHPDSASWFFAGENVLKVLKLCDGARSVDDIAKAVGEETGRDAKSLKGDITTLLEELKGASFIEGSEKLPVPKPTLFPLSSVWFHMTNKCNLNCRYCYREAGKEMENELSTEEFKAAADALKQVGISRYGLGKERIAFTGGEPLMRDDIWEVANYAKEKDIDRILVSNGTLIDSMEVARKIKESFSIVGVTLDGRKEAHDYLRGKDSYEKVIRALEYLSQVEMPIKIGGVITKRNMNDMVYLLDVAKKYNIGKISIGPMWIVGRAERDPELWLSDEDYVKTMTDFDKRHKEMGLDVVVETEKFAIDVLPKQSVYSCGAGISSTSIATNGDVFPCVAAHHDAFKMGNIREKSLKDIWENSPVVKAWRINYVDEIPKCASCFWKRFCGGACRISAYTEHGTIKAPDQYCETYCTLFSQTFWKFGMEHRDFLLENDFRIAHQN